MPVDYGFTRLSYGGETDHAGRATVMPRISPELSGIGFALGEFRVIKKQTLGLLSGNRSFNMVYADTMLCFSGVDKVVVPVGPGVQTSTHRGCKPAQCELDFNSKHCKH